MSDWNFLNKHRLRNAGPFSTTDADGFNGAFFFRIAGEAKPVRVIASDSFGWQHVSVSQGDTEADIPSWDVMCKVKDLFWDDEDVVIQIHPKKSEYVNYHPAVLHLWRCTDGRQQPTPPTILVGPKS